MAARLTPDQKVGRSNRSGLISLGSDCGPKFWRAALWVGVLHLVRYHFGFPN